MKFGYERGRRDGMREYAEKYATPRNLAEYHWNEIRLAVNEANGRPYFANGGMGTVPLNVEAALTQTWGPRWRELFRANPMSGSSRGAADL